ncbi:MAG: ABC transporter substrate-binding protein [Candidatus Rokuibacteriota bacterium]|nr:MAG: ABC transporter substrate-binding protein [Candidatus Rokubacteria bacterium]PYM71137.1 MAG: ABC transporter substrate-binding protein [Candidatus Rokubacteria bacterium]
MTRKPIALILALILAVLAAPLAAEGQQVGKVYRIGYLSIASGPSPRTEALRQGLRELGYIEGKNITIEYRFAQEKADRLRGLATELVNLKVDLIVTGGPTATRAAQQATRTLPVVMAWGGDPVEARFVASLAQPGSNITGLTSMATELGSKRLGLLKEAVPHISRVAVLWNPSHSEASASFRETEGATRALGLSLESIEVRSAADLEGAFRRAVARHADALTVLLDPVTLLNEAKVAELAARSRIPSIFYERRFATAGGLMAYGPLDEDLHRRAAGYVDKILKGAKPADLPVEQPTKFELVINLKTAKALGLTIPPSLLQRADEIIQ